MEQEIDAAFFELGPNFLPERERERKLAPNYYFQRAAVTGYSNQQQ